MNKSLEKIFEKSIEILKADSRVLGGWHFGSVGRKQDDKYSDVDPVFLINDEDFNGFDSEIPELFRKIAGDCILIWPEEFNSGNLKNYAVLIKDENGDIFQYDFTIINKSKVDKPISKMFCQDCNAENIIFDKTGEVATLLDSNSNHGGFQIDLQHQIKKYWLFCFLTVKYYKREAIFHLQNMIQELFRIHVNLLLSRSNKPLYGSLPSQIKENISWDKQTELMKYFCDSELSNIKKTIADVMNIFSKDARLVCEENGLAYDFLLEQEVKTYFENTIML